MLESAVSITAENIKLLGSFLDLASVRMEASKGSLVDVLRVQMDLEELKNQISYLEDRNNFV